MYNYIPVSNGVFTFATYTPILFRTNKILKMQANIPSSIYITIKIKF